MRCEFSSLRPPAILGLALALALATPSTSLAYDLGFCWGWRCHAVGAAPMMTPMAPVVPMALMTQGQPGLVGGTVPSGTTATAPGFVPMAPAAATGYYAPSYATPAYYAAPYHYPTASMPVAPTAAPMVLRPLAQEDHLGDFDPDAPIAPSLIGSVALGLGGQILSDLATQWANRAITDPNGLLNRAIALFGDRKGVYPSANDLQKLRRIVQRITGGGNAAGATGRPGDQVVGTTGQTGTITITITVTGANLKVQTSTGDGGDSGQAGRGDRGTGDNPSETTTPPR